MIIGKYLAFVPEALRYTSTEIITIFCYNSKIQGIFTAKSFLTDIWQTL